MDEVLNVMSEMVVDVQGFNETHFGIFPIEDRPELLDLWDRKSSRNPNTFISLISPQHKQMIAKWAVDRTSFNIKDLIAVLKQFIKVLSAMKHSFLTIRSSASSFQVEPKKLTGWRKVVYAQPKASSAASSSSFKSFKRKN